MQFTDSTLQIIIVVAVVVIFLTVVRRLRGAVGQGQVIYPYASRPMLTPAEVAFLKFVQQAAGGDVQVFPKVWLPSLIGVRPGFPAEPGAAADERLQGRHVDFVLYREGKVIGVLELDDPTRGSEQRRSRDVFLDNALNAAGITVVHVAAEEPLSLDAVLPALATLGVK